MEEQSSIKKYIIYAVLTIVIVGIMFAIFYYFFLPSGIEKGKRVENSIIGRLLGFPEPKPREEPLPPLSTSTPSEIQATSTIPAIEPKLIQLTDFSVSSMALSAKEDRVMFYKKDGGNMFSYTLNGQVKDRISNITIIGIYDVSWNTKQDRRVVSYLDQEIIKSFMHTATSVVTLLPQQIKSPVWSPDGKSLAYLSESNARTNLVVADSSVKNQKIISTTPLRDARIYWATPDRIIFETAPSGVADGFVFAFSRARGLFDVLIKGFGITSKWSPDGSLAFVSKTNNQGKQLSLTIFDSAGNETFIPNIATIAEKCFWLTIRKAYCAVPKNTQPNSVWPDDYLRGEVHTSDKLVAIDIEKNDVREVFKEKNFDMSNLLVTKNEAYTLFIDRTDGTIWSLKLK